MAGHFRGKEKKKGDHVECSYRFGTAGEKGGDGVGQLVREGLTPGLFLGGGEVQKGGKGQIGEGLPFFCSASLGREKRTIFGRKMLKRRGARHGEVSQRGENTGKLNIPLGTSPGKKKGIAFRPQKGGGPYW